MKRSRKYERGELDDEVEAAKLLTQYEARIAALERMIGRLALENELLEQHAITWNHLIA